jgi:predicted phage baseplate assembly protein
MPLPVPKLDDRTFQDLVDEAKRLIPRYCPEWTDHNVSDPGVTLIELFAWMVDILLYRLNQVPDLHYVKLMELIGMRLHEPTAAQVPVTFWLSAPQPTDVVIPRGTEVATEPYEGGEAIVFATNEDFTARVPTLVHCLTGTGEDEKTLNDVMPDLQAHDRSFYPFPGTPPQTGDTLYLGLGQNLSHHVLALSVTCEIAGGAGVDPEDPPWVWEGWDGERWQEAPVDFDQTGGFNETGILQLFLPQLDEKVIRGATGYWLRCRLEEPGERPAYSQAPELSSIAPSTMGGTIPATHAVTVENELLGRSDGSPGQIFQLRFSPVLERRNGETLQVTDESGEWVDWQEVADFSNSGAEDTHFTLDSVSGEIRFGPSLRQPDGDMRVFGAIPPRGGQIRFSRYHCGGGVIGNVQKGKLRVLTSTMPYVDRVQNRFPAVGGTDAESIDLAKTRAPSIIRAQNRAVTAEDYEFLTHEAAREVARVRCIQPAGREGDPSPGTVYLLVVPHVQTEAHEINPDDLALPEGLKQQIMEYLDERRLLTVRLEIREPEYVVVSVEAEVKAVRHLSPERVQQRVAQRLYSFLNPFTGGEEGQGWPFGRDLFLSDVYSAIQQTDGVQYVEQVKLYEVVRSGKDKARKRPMDRIELPANSLLCSYSHSVVVQ